MRLSSEKGESSAGAARGTIPLEKVLCRAERPPSARIASTGGRLLLGRKFLEDARVYAAADRIRRLFDGRRRRRQGAFLEDILRVGFNLGQDRSFADVIARQAQLIDFLFCGQTHLGQLFAHAIIRTMAKAVQHRPIHLDRFGERVEQEQMGPHVCVGIRLRMGCRQNPIRGDFLDGQKLDHAKAGGEFPA